MSVASWSGSLLGSGYQAGSTRRDEVERSQPLYHALPEGQGLRRLQSVMTGGLVRLHRVVQF